MRSFHDILLRCSGITLPEGMTIPGDVSLPDAIIQLDAEESMLDVETHREALKQRFRILRQTVTDATTEVENFKPKIVKNDVPVYAKATHTPLSGSFVWRASEISMLLATANASMGRIVAAPTAGSCGILPGLLFAWLEMKKREIASTAAGDVNKPDEIEIGEALEKKTFEGMIVAGAVGEVIANRATLAGAEGGCQAECGAAAAMGAAALTWMEGGSPESCFHAAAICIKSILGLACDPVAGLVECPCVKRNGSLVALGAISADMALAGIRSIIPPDEMIDTMGSVGRALPPSLRETAMGGCAVSLTGKRLKKDVKKRYANA